MYKTKNIPCVMKTDNNIRQRLELSRVSIYKLPLQLVNHKVTKLSNENHGNTKQQFAGGLETRDNYGSDADRTLKGKLARVR